MRSLPNERLFTGSLLLGITAVFALMIASIYVTQISSADRRRATARVTYTLEMLGRLDEIQALVAAAESAQRSYVLDGDAASVQSYGAATRGARSRIGELERVTADDPPQAERARQLRQRVGERLIQMDATLQAGPEELLTASRDRPAQSRGKATTKAVGQVIATMKEAEKGLLAQRLQDSDASSRRSHGLNLFSGALGLLALGAFVFLVDKTPRAREQAADEIARQGETLRVTLESIGDGVISTDTAGRVVFLNPEAERLTGWQTQEAAGKRIERVFNIVHEDSREQAANPATAALRDGVVVGLAHHTLLIARDGVERPIDDSAAPIRDSQGAVAGVVLIFRDVSEDRAATSQLRNLASELAEANRRKNEFLAMLAHEIRNPLAAIRNSVAVLRLAGGDPYSTVAAEGTIDRQMEHLVRLVEDLLDVARISRGKLELRRAKIDLRPALEQALESSRPICNANEQALEVEIPEAPIFVDGDAARITQAIANLLNNACKFTPRGGRIRLAVGVESGHAVVRIRDDGIGIAAEHIPRLFDMFSQIDVSLERTHGGLGIGLNLVRQLVEMDGGRVEVRSDGVGKGSEFVVHFPLLEAAPAPVAALLPAAAPLAALTQARTGKASPAVGTGPGSGRRILVVDDNADSADSLAMLLQLQGHETAVARDGVEAVTAALSSLPDVVLLDIGLPRMSGYEAARRIRMSPLGGGILLIAITGWGQDADRVLSRAAGFDHHLVKPVDIAVLSSLLERSARAIAQ